MAILKIRKNCFPIFLLIFMLMGIIKTVAQETMNHLVIKQIYLENSLSEKNWIEIYNPTDSTLILERFRTSNIMTTNALPDYITRQGGIPIAPGEYIIICANESIFKSSFGAKIKCFEVKALSHLDSGGYITIKTGGSKLSKAEVVQYGERVVSTKASIIAGNQVLDFSKEGKSFKRKVTYAPTGIILSDFIESSLEPGY